MSGEPERCVPCAYRVQWPRNRAAQLIVLWSLLVFCCVNWLKGILLEKLDSRQIVWQIVVNYALSFIVFVIYPFSSYLGDAYFKRFSIVRASLVILWSGVVLCVVTLVLEEVYHDGSTQLPKRSVFYALFIILYVYLSVGMIGFHANMIPFGLEQLQSSPAEEVVAFLHCYIFTEALGLVVANALIPNCATIGVDSTSNESVLIQSVICSLLLTVAFVCILLPKHMCVFIVEDPTAYNPLPLICRVLKYTARTRSWPSASAAWWTDVASTKGFLPYTTGQMDDARAFFRIIPILLPYFVVMIGNVTTIILAMFAIHLKWGGVLSPERCFDVMTIGNLPGITVVLCVLLYHFIVYPIFHRYVPSMLTRLSIGITFFAASAFCCLVIELVGHHETMVRSLFEDTSLDTSVPTLNIPFTLAVFPGLLSGVANFIVTTSIYEFICAQAPFGMRGLLVGLKYGSAGLGVLTGFSVLLLFRWLDQQVDHIYYFFNTLTFATSIIIVLAYKHLYVPFRSYTFDTQAIDGGSFHQNSTTF